MRVYTDQQMISLLPTTSEDVEKGSKVFEAGSCMFSTEGFLKHAVLEGWTVPFNVCYEEEPEYLLCVHKSVDNGLYVDAVAKIGKRERCLHIVYAMVDQLVKEQKARYIRFMTRSKSVAEQSMRHGYTIESVCLTKMV